MATIDFKCDTCKRNITLAENPLGMTVFAKCIITEGCKGTLYKISRNESITGQVGDFPPSVAGLNDYVQRRAFFPELINIPSNPWKINHNLGTSPAVTVYILDDNDDTSELSADEYVVTIIDKDNIEIEFASAQRGIVHNVARSSVPLEVQTVADAGSLFQVSNVGWMNFGSVSVINTDSGQQFLTEDDFDLQIELQVPSSAITGISGENRILKDQLDTNSPWFGWEQILVRKRRNFATKNMQILDAFQEAFGAGNITNLGDIPDGSSFEIQKIRYRNQTSGYLGEYEQIEPRALLLLLANSPYGVVDKIRDQGIDIGELPLATNGRFFIFDGEVFINQDNIERIYPRLELTLADNLLNTPTPSVTPTNTVTPTVTPTITVTISDTPPITPTNTVTPTVSDIPGISVTPTPTVSDTPAVTPPITPTVTPTITQATPTVTPTITPTVTAPVTPTITPTVTFTVTPTVTVTSSIPEVVLIPWGSTTILVFEDPPTDRQAGHVIIGHDGEGNGWAGQWRRETGPPFDTPVADWWSQSGTDISTAPLSQYQDFYVYFKFISSGNSPNLFSGNAALGTWINMGTTRVQIIDDDSSPFKSYVYDPYMIYSPSGTPVGDPSVSPPIGTVFMGRITLEIENII